MEQYPVGVMMDNGVITMTETLNIESAYSGPNKRRRRTITKRRSERTTRHFAKLSAFFVTSDL